MGFVWLTLFACWHDYAWWHLEGYWAPVVVVFSIGCIGLWLPWHPWFDYKRFYAAKKVEFDARPMADAVVVNKIIHEAIALGVSLKTDTPPETMTTYSQILGDIILAFWQEDRPVAAFPAMLPFSVGHERERYALERRTLEESLLPAQQDGPRLKAAIEAGRAVGDTCLDRVSGDYGGPFLFPLVEYMRNPASDLENITNILYQQKYIEMHIGDTFRNAFHLNRQQAAASVMSKSEFSAKGYINLRQYPTSKPTDLVEVFFKGTSLYPLFMLPLPWRISENLRPEHGVIVAGSGGGKTQFIESLILDDLDQDDPPGIILIDSKGEMIERIAHLDVFHPDHGALRDRLIIIDHKDKPALNMFDVEEELVNTKINEIASLMRYFFGGLFGSALSDQMDVLFLPLLHMVLRIPGATLTTFADLVGNPKKFPDVLAKIPQGPRNFILNHWDNPAYSQTKTAIITRLYRIINEVTLDEMFGARNNAVNIGKALNEGKIILVSTDAEGLQDLSPVFGKYIIAQVMNAGLSRGSKQTAKRRPIHLYIDECKPYVDDKLAQVLTTIRSYGIGVMMAFQGEWQMGAYTPVILGNTAIKVVGEASDADARTFAADMRTDPEFIMAQRKSRGVGKFACFTRDLPRAISIELPFGQLDKRKPMSDRDYHRMRMFNRHKLMAEPTPSKPEDDFKGPTIDGTAYEVPSNQRGLPSPSTKRRTRQPPPPNKGVPLSDDF
jgi:hypothetical protein